MQVSRSSVILGDTVHDFLIEYTCELMPWQPEAHLLAGCPASEGARHFRHQHNMQTVCAGSCAQDNHNAQCLFILVTKIPSVRSQHRIPQFAYFHARSQVPHLYPVCRTASGNTHFSLTGGLASGKGGSAAGIDLPGELQERIRSVWWFQTVGSLVSLNSATHAVSKLGLCFRA